MDTQKRIIMIEADPKRRLNSGKSEFKKVAAYCRVSTDDEEQLNSYQAQIAYYTETIGKNPSWHFAGIYADEGITGTGTKNRKAFLRLMKDCERGKVDLILTKSISRFARNTVDSLTWVRKLRAMGVGVYFEEQAINSLKSDSEMLIGMFSVLAQSESENIGANVRWGIRQSMKKGQFCSNFSCYGYRKGENGVPVIQNEEAQVVRHIFDLYLEGKSYSQISHELDEMKVKTYNEKDHWYATAVAAILKNEKYTGDLLLQKTYVEDTISKKVKKNRGELTKYLVKNNHPAIIDSDTFNLVQIEMARRANLNKKSKATITDNGKYSGKHVLTDILYCSHCGRHFRRKVKTVRGEKVYYWRCLGCIEKSCHEGASVDEDVLEKSICRCVSQMLCQDVEDGEVNILLSNSLKHALVGDEETLDATQIERQIETNNETIDSLMKRADETTGDPSKYEKEIIKLYEEIGELRERLSVAEEKAKANEEVELKVMQFQEDMKRYRENEKSIEVFDDVTIRRLVECIHVSHDKEITVTLFDGSQKKDYIY